MNILRSSRRAGFSGACLSLPNGSRDATQRAIPAPATVFADDAATRIVSHALAPLADGSGDGDPPWQALLPVGSRVAEFEIARVVGRGGFGVVYEAWDHTLERRVAIKEYLPAASSTRRSDGSVVPLSQRHRETFELGWHSFVNEARLLARFDHPSLVKVHRFWQERGTTYMVMPFYRGDTLRQTLAARKGAVDESWLLEVMDGVTQALGVMHASHCYHRDIAPDNILLLEGSGRPVVLDFGAAQRVVGHEPKAASVILKPGYSPIEQYAGMTDAPQGPWTDVYALAALMHVAVRGFAPPPSVARLLDDAHVPLAGDEVLRQRFSPRLLAAIDAGLAVRAQARPQSMDDLRAALGLETEVVRVSEGSVPRPAKMVVPVARSCDPHRASKARMLPLTCGAAVRSAAPRVQAFLASARRWWLDHGPAAVCGLASPTRLDGAGMRPWTRRRCRQNRSHAGAP